jgi:hypothetical protein
VSNLEQMSKDKAYLRNAGRMDAVCFIKSFLSIPFIPMQNSPTLGQDHGIDDAVRNLYHYPSVIDTFADVITTYVNIVGLELLC